MSVEDYLRATAEPERSVSISIDLNESGYRRLSDLTERLVRRFPAATLADTLFLVIEAGTDVCEARIAKLTADSGLILPN